MVSVIEIKWGSVLAERSDCQAAACVFKARVSLWEKMIATQLRKMQTSVFLKFKTCTQDAYGRTGSD